MAEVTPPKRVKVAVVLSLGLAIAGVALPSMLTTSRAQAAPNVTAKGPKPGFDDDGDDMRYHWQNPAYASEETLQMGIIAAGVVMVAIGSRVKRLRRAAK